MLTWTGIPVKQFIQIHLPLYYQHPTLHLCLYVIRHIDNLTCVRAVQFTISGSGDHDHRLRDVGVKIQTFAHDAPAGERAVVDDYVEPALR